MKFYRLVTLTTILIGTIQAAAQDLEPRRWTPLPVGTTVAELS